MYILQLSRNIYISMHDSIAIVLIEVFTACTRMDRNTGLLHVCHLINSKRSLMPTLPAFACLCIFCYLTMWHKHSSHYCLQLLIIDIYVICIRLITGYVHMKSISVMKLHMTSLLLHECMSCFLHHVGK